MSNTDTLELLFAIGKAGMRPFAHKRHCIPYRRKARASRFANRRFALLLAAGAIVLSLHAPARPTPNPAGGGSCVDVSCCRKANTHDRRGLVQGEVRSDAKCRQPDLLIIGSPPLSDAALKSLIDQAIVPALVDRFLAQKGAIAAGRDGTERRLISDGAAAHNGGEKS